MPHYPMTRTRHPLVSKSPISPSISRTSRSYHLLARLLVSCLLLLVIGATAPTTLQPTSAAAPGDTGRTTVPNLSPGNAEIDIDAFWREIFTTAGFAYAAPAVIPFSAPFSSGCGYVTPAELIAFYCAADVAVYWSTPSYDAASRAGGDAAWVNVMAHEWSHHAQVLLGTNTPWRRANDIVNLELEATCMGGVYVADARTRDLVDDPMITTMVGMFVGSPFHGSTEQVQAAFRGGLDTGISACGLALPVAVNQSTAAANADATDVTNAKTRADADTAGGTGPGTDTRVTGAAVNLRAAPSTTSTVRALLSPANTLEITGPARTANGYTWYPVTDRTTGESGYVAAQFLAL